MFSDLSHDDNDQIALETRAAMVLVAAARIDGRYTEVERDRVAKGLMKLFLKATGVTAIEYRDAAAKMLEQNPDWRGVAEDLGDEVADFTEALMLQVWTILRKSTAAEEKITTFVEQLAEALHMDVDRALALSHVVQGGR